MRVINVNRRLPVLEWMVPAAEGLAWSKEATLVTSTQPEFMGLALDVYMSLSILDDTLSATYQFFPQMKSPAKLYHGKKLVRRGDYTLNLVFNDREEYDASPPDHMELTCLIKTGHVGYDPISAAMNDSKRLSDNPRYDKIRKTLPKRLLPKPDRRMKLSLSCGFFTELPVNQSWHDFDPVEIAEKPKSGKLVAHYPVSEKSEHVMSKQGYEFFYHPVRWNETGRRCAKMINVMAGNRTYGEIAKQKNMDPAVVKEKFEYVEPICLQLIETDVKSMIAGKHEKFTSICDDLQCPVYVRGFFLRPVLSSIKYFGNRGAYYNPERRGFAQNIVDYVNSRLTANRKPTITVEQFCGVY